MKIKLYQVPLIKEDMDRLVEITGAGTHKEALEIAVEYMLKTKETK